MEKGYSCVETMKERNIRSYKNKIVVNGTKFYYSGIMSEDLPLDRQYYVDFQNLPNFPAIDGCSIDKYAIYGAQMTVKDDHDTKNNVIVLLSVYLFIF